MDNFAVFIPVIPGSVYSYFLLNSYIMKILLCNDDGYGAPGLEALACELRKNHQVWIVAPKANRSGASCSMNLFKQMELKSIKENEYSLDGTPVDCIMLALRGDFLPGKPDVVISGINKGGNLGTDILYSGTCGASRQAALYGVPGIALSVEYDGGDISYEALARHAAENLEQMVELVKGPKANEGGTSLKYFLNVNAWSLDSYKGVKYASVSERTYGDKVVVTKDSDGNTYVAFDGSGEKHCYGDRDNDLNVVEQGYIAYTKVLTIDAFEN